MRRLLRRTVTCHIIEWRGIVRMSFAREWHNG